MWALTSTSPAHQMSAFTVVSIGLPAQDCMDTVEKFTLTSTILSHLVLFCNNCIYKKKTRFAPLPYPMGKMCEIVTLKLITRENWESVRS